MVYFHISLYNRCNDITLWVHSWWLMRWCNDSMLFVLFNALRWNMKVIEDSTDEWNVDPFCHFDIGKCRELKWIDCTIARLCFVHAKRFTEDLSMEKFLIYVFVLDSISKRVASLLNICDFDLIWNYLDIACVSYPSHNSNRNLKDFSIDCSIDSVIEIV